MAFRRMWSGFSSEIETYTVLAQKVSVHRVACGAASHLRLKPGALRRDLVRERIGLWRNLQSLLNLDPGAGYSLKHLNGSDGVEQEKMRRQRWAISSPPVRAMHRWSSVQDSPSFFLPPVRNSRSPSGHLGQLRRTSGHRVFSSPLTRKHSKRRI